MISSMESRETVAQNFFAADVMFRLNSDIDEKRDATSYEPRATAVSSSWLVARSSRLLQVICFRLRKRSQPNM